MIDLRELRLREKHAESDLHFLHRLRQKVR